MAVKALQEAPYDTDWVAEPEREPFVPAVKVTVYFMAAKFAVIVMSFVTFVTVRGLSVPV